MRKKRRKMGKGKVIALNQMPLRPSDRSPCPFSHEGSPKIDYKDVKTLKNYVSEQGKIMPSRMTLVAQKKQRILSREIKRARFLALMPFVQEDIAPKPHEGGGYARDSYGEHREHREPREPRESRGAPREEYNRDAPAEREA